MTGEILDVLTVEPSGCCSVGGGLVSGTEIEESCFYRVKTMTMVCGGISGKVWTGFTFAACIPDYHVSWVALTHCLIIEPCSFSCTQQTI